MKSGTAEAVNNVTMKSKRKNHEAILKSAITGSVFLLAGCSAEEKAPDTLPNIILINVDDLGWTDAACLGSDFYETPNIDRLAKEGMRFTNYYAACALCSPTRASMMTGKYPSRMGITDWIRAGFQPGGKIPGDGKNPSGYEKAEGKEREYLTPRNPLWMELDEVTIAEVLKTNGYTTCHIGKWHLGPEGYYPEDQGFDYNIGGCDYGEPPSYFDPYTRASMPELNYDTIPDIPGIPSRKPGEYLTDRESWEALNFIRNHKNESFFLNMCHYAVHVPLQAKAELTEKYENKEKGLHAHPIYAAMIEDVDNAVGEIILLLDSLDLRKKTLLIFTSDNGGLIKPDANCDLDDPVTSNFPLRSGKAFPYEGGIRVPLIANWPGRIPANSMNDQMLSSIDLFPTFCEIVESSVPDSLEIDGISFLPLLLGEGEFKGHDHLIWHYPHYRDWDKMVPYSIIREGKWKMIKWYGSQKPELYNLAEDIGEKDNLASQMPQKIMELDEKLYNTLVKTNSLIPIITDN
jgi:arylsulfatase A